MNSQAMLAASGSFGVPTKQTLFGLKNGNLTKSQSSISAQKYASLSQIQKHGANKTDIGPVNSNRVHFNRLYTYRNTRANQCIMQAAPSFENQVSFHDWMNGNFDKLEDGKHNAS